ncbi:MAG TPA: SPOR domain-containing protein [Chitinophagaceae bacterium]|nr:SPOR domain-containing protein [Chitinophagaceae bacterium]
MKFIFTIAAFIFVATCSAQKDTALITAVDSNTVIIHKDSRLDLLVKTQATINEVTSRDSRKTDKGFRLMVISTNNREEALAAKTKIYTYFPELKAYLWYQSPYFRVKAGNFKDQKDAESYQKRMNIYFPKGVFIMKDIIEVKPAKNNQADDINP